MKCESCLKLLEEYFDGALTEFEAEQVGAHLLTCMGCAGELDLLSSEQEIYSRYDRGIEIAPSMWTAIAARTTDERVVVNSESQVSLRDWMGGLFATSSWGVSLAGAAAVVLVAMIVGFAYLKSQRQTSPLAAGGIVVRNENKGTTAESIPGSIKKSIKKNEQPLAPLNLETPKGPGPGKKSSAESRDSSNIMAQSRPTLRTRSNAVNQPDDVLFSDVAYSAADEEDTLKHIEQAQNLLRSVRNLEVSDDDGEIDVSYEKALSRRLLNENVVLRRDAEMSGKFPVKELLSSLEPFLIDIANLPDKTSVDDLRVIKERVQKTEIVAALHSY
jgi:Putative zinc-finger